MSRTKFLTVNIKGKAYVQVNERVRYFRETEKYNGYRMTTDIIKITPEEVTMEAKIFNAENDIVANGFANEVRGSSFINKTSYIENCETSAWGRALANLGIGVSTSIASAEEVAMAIDKQVNNIGTQPIKKKTDERTEMEVELLALLKDAGKDITKSLPYVEGFSDKELISKINEYK